jgi:hypothetical protein
MLTVLPPPRLVGFPPRADAVAVAMFMNAPLRIGYVNHGHGAHNLVTGSPLAIVPPTISRMFVYDEQGKQTWPLNPTTLSSFVF